MPILIVFVKKNLKSLFSSENAPIVIYSLDFLSGNDIKQNCKDLQNETCVWTMIKLSKPSLSNQDCLTETPSNFYYC